MSGSGELTPLATGRLADVRAGTNLDVNSLSDDALASAINRAVFYVAPLIERSGIGADIIELAILNYAIYLAYQIYADRIIETLPGTFNQQGTFEPIANPLARQVIEKLHGLKQTSDETLELVRNTPINVSIGETPMPSDLEDYPDTLKLSNLDSDW